VSETRRDEKAEAIARCQDSSGRIKPETVVEKARNPKHTLHREFEWDDSKAAHLHRIDTARQLIREVKFTVVHENVKIIAPYYVSDPSAEESMYVPTIKVAKSRELAKQVILDELERIKGAIRRARSLSEVFKMEASFDELLDHVIAVGRGLE
jgi:hypothetical protein